MSQLNCLIIDDEPVARKVLREYIEEMDFLNLCGEAGNPVKAISLLQQHNIDLIFLDIQMPRMTGIEMLQSIPVDAQVIITTAYPEYALQGYELNVLDYLVKPVSVERFIKAVNKAGKGSVNASEDKKDFFFVKCNQKIERINYADVVYFEGKSNYVLIHTVSKNYLTYLTFKKLESFLPEDKFIRIHKSYIIALDKLQSIEENMVDLGTTSLPVSVGSKEALMKKIEGVFLKRS